MVMILRVFIVQILVLYVMSDMQAGRSTDDA
jgi:hypothetical protein